MLVTDKDELFKYPLGNYKFNKNYVYQICLLF